MKKITRYSILTLLISGFSIASAHADAQSPKTLAERFSYGLGTKVAGDIGRMAGTLDADFFIRGLQDQLGGKKLLLTPDQVKSAISDFRQQQMQARKKEMQQQSSKNSAEGNTFLAHNKTLPGVVTTASGLQYKIMKPGHGAKPKATDKVKVHYRGTLLDGTEFDSSHKRGQPATFPLNRVIPGWTEGVQLMPVGSQYRFFVPSNLAYGKRGSPPKIGADATLTFDVDLLEIVH